MKLLKIEDHNYQIIYINDNESYDVYRRSTNGKWDIYRRDKWANIKDCDKLEKFYKTLK